MGSTAKVRPGTHHFLPTWIMHAPCLCHAPSGWPRGAGGGGMSYPWTVISIGVDTKWDMGCGRMAAEENLAHLLQHQLTCNRAHLTLHRA